MKWRLWLATLGLAGCAEAGSLTLCYEDVDIYPLSYGKSEGLNYFMLQTMARHLDLKITYKQLPWKRCQFEVRQGISDGIFLRHLMPSAVSMPITPCARMAPRTAITG